MPNDCLTAPIPRANAQFQIILLLPFLNPWRTHTYSLSRIKKSDICARVPWIESHGTQLLHDYFELGWSVFHRCNKCQRWINLKRKAYSGSWFQLSIPGCWPRCSESLVKPNIVVETSGRANCCQGGQEREVLGTSQWPNIFQLGVIS